MVLLEFIGLSSDLLPIAPSLLPFFDASHDSIFRFGKTYKKERGTSLTLCRCPRMNVVVLLSKKDKRADYLLNISFLPTDGQKTFANIEYTNDYFRLKKELLLIICSLLLGIGVGTLFQSFINI
nr:hypothetical protein [uncultured bacterium]